MVDNLALSGVFPGSSGIPATELAALDAADVCRAKNLFTDGASYPFWSPDGRTLGFFADRKLRKIPAGGGTSVTE